MKVAAFDIATSMGVAWGEAGSVPSFRTIDLGKGQSDGLRFSKIIRVTAQFMREVKPDVVAYEAPVGGAKTSHLLVGMAACFVGQCVRAGVEPHKVNIDKCRKHFVGRALRRGDFPGKVAAQKRALKQVVIDRCHLLKWPVETDDEADACGIWDFACATWGRVQVAPLGRLFNA